MPEANWLHHCRLQPSSLLIHELGEEFCVSTTNASGQAQEVGVPQPCPYDPVPPTTLLNYQRIRPEAQEVGAPRRSCMHAQASLLPPPHPNPVMYRLQARPKRCARHSHTNLSLPPPLPLLFCVQLIP